MSDPQQPAPPPEQPGGGPNPYGQQPPAPGAPQYGGGYGGPTAGPQPGDPGTLDLPYYGIGFVDAVKRAFQKYARFDGRASRGEYWWFVLGVFLVEVALYIPLLAALAAESTGLAALFGVLFGVFVLAVFVPSLAVAVRRLHDAGFSGWLILLGLVPFAGIVVLIFMVLPPKPEGAKYDKVSGTAPGYGAAPGAPGGYPG